METIQSPLEATTHKGLLFDVESVREAFPILHQNVRPNKPLVYFDNAASCQTPLSVIEAITRFYTEDYSNIHRGVHALSQRATQQYEDARFKLQRFINAEHESEVIFVRGTTEAINLVAQSYGHTHLQKGDEVIVSAMEHHSNIVPWQILEKQIGISLKVIPMDTQGVLSIEGFEQLITPKTKFLSLSHVSNALGTINPVKKFIKIAHQHNIPVLLDGAQAAPHIKLDMQDLDCDFYALSGHKMYAPTGIGILYGKKALLDEMEPYQGGGDMIRSVTFEGSVFADLPSKFEAGTPNIAGSIGLGAAVDWIEKIGINKIAEYERELLLYATKAISKIPNIRIIGTAPHKASVLSFVLDDIHPHDISTILDMEGIAIRSGQHCSQPIMDFFGLSATARASFAAYNTKKEIDLFVFALQKTIEIFK